MAAGLNKNYFMKTTFHRIYTKSNIELHGLLHQPDQPTKTVVAYVHGMGGSFYGNAFLDQLAKTLTSAGIAFCPMNNRGAGLIETLIKVTDSKVEYLNEGGSARERFEGCVEDIGAHLDFLEDCGFETIHLAGHSLGSPKVVYYAAKSGDQRPQSLTLISPSDMLGLVREDMSEFQDWIDEANKMIAAGQGDALMSRYIWGEYPISANTYVNLFADDSKAAVFNFFKPDDDLPVLKEVAVPVLAVMGTKDNALTISINETMDRLEKGFSASPKFTSHVVENGTHDYRGFEEELASTVTEWITNLS